MVIGGEVARIIEGVDCNQGNDRAKSQNPACVWLEAFILQLLLYCGSYYGVGDFVGRDVMHD